MGSFEVLVFIPIILLLQFAPVTLAVPTKNLGGIFDRAVLRGSSSNSNSDEDTVDSSVSREMEKYYKYLAKLDEKYYKKKFIQDMSNEARKEVKYFSDLLEQLKNYNKKNLRSG